MSEDVKVEKRGAVGIVAIDRPDVRNALTRAVVLSLGEHFRALAVDPSVRCIILTGRGGHFCAGADLKKTLAEDPDLMDHLDQYLDAYHALVRAIVRCEKPTIAMLDGAAVGFGCDMAFCCDLRVASPDAYMQEKFVKIGLMPDGGGTFWLPRLIGTSRALKAMLLGDKIEASELDALGLLTKLVPKAELEEATIELARELAAGPPLAYARIKRAVYANLGDLENALRLEREGQLELLKSQDAMEGIMAWAQKREPQFQGK